MLKQNLGSGGNAIGTGDTSWQTSFSAISTLILQGDQQTLLEISLTYAAINQAEFHVRESQMETGKFNNMCRRQLK
ncbi:hypothetical protein HGH93_21315 [Chitinophaga polysaccharea]|uniref:hypothetical protein n=1 Tax=Chitinophaga TaxID=79328 RepID=UPI001454ED0E|nr:MULTISPECIES: hypothetical protein [Chitinophaga]NLR60663.1 hypothetical protein [Chitinophaga polysaccharea]NLU90648.1 hypothetical protein [Chitinophaga sp. Ak27]